MGVLYYNPTTGVIREICMVLGILCCNSCCNRDHKGESRFGHKVQGLMLKPEAAMFV